MPKSLKHYLKMEKKCKQYECEWAHFTQFVIFLEQMDKDIKILG